jgi:hypothetical protein
VAIIEKVSKDPALLRSLVYALAWNSLIPDCVVAYPGARAKQRAKTLVELDRVFSLESAIKRVEAETSRQSNKIISAPQQSPPDRIPETREFGTWYHNAQLQNPQNRRAAFYRTSQIPRWWSQKNEGYITIGKRVLAWTARTFGLQVPKWVQRKIGSPLKTMRFGPIGQPKQPRRHALTLMRLVGASLIGIALCGAICGWLYRQQHSSLKSAANALPTAKDAGASASPLLSPVQPVLPVSLAKPFSVYASNNGQLKELDQLTIKIPDHRAPISDEIITPSSTTIEGGKIAFLVLKRDLADNAPHTATVRVVARISRRFHTPTQQGQAWRIRPNSYNFIVSSVTGREDVILIQPSPGISLPAGRYALVLKEFGYDFSVSGPALSSEHCLEEVMQTSNGSVFSECPKW